ncbi:hypothetical protein WICMUC_003230 [Wickerhamomyces mucosus]|uniref:Uncharacterized protein n=1 Tax=Wickerhamomyces mucosus TaxID=1378264 RepID=A0A9P8TCL8_9ASCO|nr:hypothetical protein WICMUC_003230 [Wickerhamomyces mucosus]
MKRPFDSLEDSDDYKYSPEPLLGFLSSSDDSEIDNSDEFNNSSEDELDDGFNNSSEDELDDEFNNSSEDELDDDFDISSEEELDDDYGLKKKLGIDIHDFDDIDIFDFDNIDIKSLDSKSYRRLLLKVLIDSYISTSKAKAKSKQILAKTAERIINYIIVHQKKVGLLEKERNKIIDNSLRVARRYPDMPGSKEFIKKFGNYKSSASLTSLSALSLLSTLSSLPELKSSKRRKGKKFAHSK